ncbi:MAG: DNA repair protein RadC [Rhodospirillales bacterium]|nr:DNA repair protein RadC [Rhodospirillales bacterium]
MKRQQSPDPEGEKRGPVEQPDAHYRNHRDRVRRRFLDGDPERFQDYELLELLLFYSVDRVDVKPLAKQLLADFKSYGAVLAAPPERLAGYPRISERTIAHFKAVRESARRMLYGEVSERPLVSSWPQLLDYCRAAMADEPVERFRILFLDRKNRIIADEVQQKGTVDHTPVYPREVLKRALELGASGLILVHNHPSGDPTPSRGDIDMTREIREAADKLDIALFDHIVVGRREACSFKANGLL